MQPIKLFKHILYLVCVTILYIAMAAILFIKAGLYLNIGDVIGFILSVAGAVISLTGGIFLLCTKPKKENENDNTTR